MVPSKWIHFGSAALVSIFGLLAAMDWTSVVSAHTAAEIVVGLGAAKMLLSVATDDSK